MLARQVKQETFLQAARTKHFQSKTDSKSGQLMKVLKGMEDIPLEFRDSFITIGNFDGVHRGHQFLFKTLIQEARQENRKTLVITFDPHPKKLLHPDRRPFYLITTLEEKIRLIEKLGIDAIMVIPFSLEFSETTADEFVHHILWDKLHIRKIYIGHDYTFGRNKEGDEAFLSALGRKLGFEVSIMNAFTIDDMVISSTCLRYAILTGDVKKSAEILGRPYNLSGIVIEGSRRGGTLGFPTANIKPVKVLIPANGVYAAVINMGGDRYQGVLNVGYNPTFADEKLSIEVHILDFKDNIYGKNLEILFIDRIRDEIKFDSPDSLVRQIRQDIDQATVILKPLF
jgi:riboflavin kinase/FMN adenylyltransferase